MSLVQHIRSLVANFTRAASRHATENELAVLRSVLSGDDPRFAKLISQLEDAPDIERVNPTPETFRVGPTSTFDDLSFPIEAERTASEWLSVRDRKSRRTIEFRAVVGRHGFLRGLEGRTTDGGPWPDQWHAEMAPAPQERPLLRLPSIAEQRAIQELGRSRMGAWLGIVVPASVRLYPPAPEGQVASKESELGGRIPAAMRLFLSISNGLDLEAQGSIHGVDDIYQVESLGTPSIVIAWDSDNKDDFLVVIPFGEDTAVHRVDVHADEPRPRVIAADLPEYLRSRIAST